MAGGRNNTAVTKFILLGFLDKPQMKVFLFILLLGIYLLSLAWNLILITFIRMDTPHHTPMYFFFSNLSFLDICYSSSTAPKMLSDIITDQNTIFVVVVGCTTQYFVFCGMGLTECLLLAAMAYGQYAAVCNPLLYTAFMSHALCLKLVVSAYMGGFLSSLIETCSVYQNYFCGPNIINHVFCDLPLVLAMACSDIFTSQIVTFILGVVVLGAVPVVLISNG